MKRVEYWRWWIWNLQGTKKVKTSYRMSEAAALKQHPEATKVEGSMEVREILETDEEIAANLNTKPGQRL